MQSAAVPAALRNLTWQKRSLNRAWQNKSLSKRNNLNVIITGGASGIGLACAMRFLLQKATHVVIIDKNNLQESDRQTLAKLASKNQFSRFDFIHFDFSNLEKINGVVLKIATEQFRDNGIHVLINNHAVFNFGKLGIPNTSSHTKTDKNLSVDQWKEIFDVNVLSYALMIQAVVPIMQKNTPTKQFFTALHEATNMSSISRGAIVNLSSVAAFTAAPENVAYHMSKAAVSNMTQSVAKDLASLQIRVNAVAPGSILTKASLNHMKMLNLSEQQGRQQFAHAAPLNRQGHPMEVAHLIHFLCSSNSEFITGQTFVIDGGLLLHVDNKFKSYENAQYITATGSSKIRPR